MSKLKDAIIGLVVGDAFGVPYEFHDRDCLISDEMVGYSTHNQPAGTWSDDSSMTLATVKSLIDCDGKIDLDDMTEKFLAWMHDAEFTPYGRVFDIGARTAHALNFPGLPCEINDNGNGSLMRILPLAFVDCTNQDIINVSAITHSHEISTDACVIYITIAKNLLGGVDLQQAIEYASRYSDLKEFSRLTDLQNLSVDNIKSTGYVVDTLEAALWCLLTTNNYKDAILKAVNLGGDTDTIAAITGGLAGIMYGISGIPLMWLLQIKGLKEINDLCDEMASICK